MKDDARFVFVMAGIGLVCLWGQSGFFDGYSADDNLDYFLVEGVPLGESAAYTANALSFFFFDAKSLSAI